jgi:hypothetical protein
LFEGDENENAQSLTALALTGCRDFAGNYGEALAAEPESFRHGHDIQGRALIFDRIPATWRQRLRE